MMRRNTVSVGLMSFFVCATTGLFASGFFDGYSLHFAIEKRFTSNELIQLKGKTVISTNPRYESSPGTIVGFEEFGKRNQINVHFERHGVLRDVTVAFNKECFDDYLTVAE